MTDTRDSGPGFNVDIAKQIAPTWERRRAFIEETASPVREWMLSALEPQPGDTVLELAAGVGDTGFEAAAAVGPQGRLITSDSSPDMLDAARRRGAELGRDNVEYRVVDAERIELDTDSVDGVLCRFGYMLMPDPARAFAETRRVLRPGGRVALAVWGPPEQNPFFTTMMMALVERGHMAPPQPSGPGLFALADPARTTAMLEDAGFADVRTEMVQGRFAVAGAEDYVQVIADTAGPAALVVRALGDTERAAVTAHCEAALERFAVDGGYHIPNAALCALAR